MSKSSPPSTCLPKTRPSETRQSERTLNNNAMSKETVYDTAPSDRPSPEHQLSTRRLLERLSGIRLIAFLVLAAVQVCVLIALSQLALFPVRGHMAFLLVILSAIGTLFTLCTGSLRLSLATKISLNAFLVLWFIRIIRHVFITGDEELSLNLFAILTIQTVLLLAISLAYEFLSRPSNIKWSFGIRNLLILMATFAIVFPAIRYSIRRWPVDELMDSGPWPGILGAATVNLLWCFAVLAVYLNHSLVLNLISGFRKQGSPTEKQEELNADRWHLQERFAIGCALIVLAVSIGFFSSGNELSESLAGTFLSESEKTAGAPFGITGTTTAVWERMLTMRIVFVTWIAIAMLPVFNFSAWDRDKVNRRESVPSEQTDGQS